MENKENLGKCCDGGGIATRNFEVSKQHGAHENVDFISEHFNPNAEPFRPRQRRNVGAFINVGPTNISVNAEVWNAIASSHNRLHHQQPPVNTMLDNSADGRARNLSNISQLLYLPPPFDLDSSRQFVFRRDFGPVPSPEGVELRLRAGIRVFLTVDGSILVENGLIRMAINQKTNACAIEHPNGMVYKNLDRVDIIAYDGLQRNNYIRLAKMWKDCISFTSVGCALTYLVDCGGMRTTSDHVNRDWGKDYCRLVFLDGALLPDEITRNHAASAYQYKAEKDGTEVFVICGVRISQAKDGMLRVHLNPRCVTHETIAIRTSVENRSVTLKLNNFHCTASLGKSPHLFIRYNERRVHFDGVSFCVRNLGHSASFNEENHIRIH